MTNSKKKTKYSEEEFFRIVDDAAIILQRKSDHVMNIKQVAEYLGISEGAVRKRCQRKQLPFHRSASRLYFSIYNLRFGGGISVANNYFF